MSRRWTADHEVLVELPTIEIAASLMAVLIEQHRRGAPIDTVFGFVATAEAMARAMGRFDLADKLEALLPQKDRGPIVRYMDAVE